MSSTAVAHDVSEPGQLELWQICGAVTGLDGADLGNVLSHFDTDDASMALALRGTLNAMEPESSAAVVRNFLRFLRDDVHMVPLDHVRWRTTCSLIRAGFAHSRSLPNPCSTRVFFSVAKTICQHQRRLRRSASAQTTSRRREARLSTHSCLSFWRRAEKSQRTTKRARRSSRKS